MPALGCRSRAETKSGAGTGIGSRQGSVVALQAAFRTASGKAETDRFDPGLQNRSDLCRCQPRGQQDRRVDVAKSRRRQGLRRRAPRHV